MRKKILIILPILIVLSLLGYFAYRTFSPKSEDSSGYIKGLYPASVIDTFYTSYISLTDSGEKRAFYRDSKYLTGNFIKELDGKYSSNAYGEYDFLVCSIGSPLGVNIKDPSYKGDSESMVYVEANFSGLYSGMNIELVKEKGEWRIDNVVCPTEPPSVLTEGQVSLYFMNKSKGTQEHTSEECFAGDFVQRPLDMSQIAGTLQDELAYISLKELVAGPNEEERAQGYESIFSANSSGILNIVSVKQDSVLVDMTDIRGVLPEAAEGCGRDQFFSQIIETLGKNLGVTDVVFSINGNTDLFYNWTGTVCRSELCTDSDQQSSKNL
jgi:hypothetical protein